MPIGDYVSARNVRLQTDFGTLPSAIKYLLADKGLLGDLVDRKILFQVNLLSLTGFYSKSSQRFCRKLVGA